METSLWSQRVMWVGWPSFLVACVLETLVFAVVDPQSLQWFGHPLSLSTQGVYTIAFFVFWAVAMLASMLTLVLSQPTRVPDDPTQAPAD
jgi:hypothetical protein